MSRHWRLTVLVLSPTALHSWQQDISMVWVPEEHRRAQQRFGHLIKN
jgi:hypothetical protein